MRRLEPLYRNILLLLVVAYVAAMVFMWQQTLKVSERSLSHINSLFAREFQRTLRENKRVLLTMDRQLRVPGGGQAPENSAELVKNITGAMPGSVGFGLAQADGKVVLDSILGTEGALPDLATDANFRDDFGNMLRSGQTRVGRPYYLEAVERWVVPVFAPIFDDVGELTTVFMGRFFAGASGKNWSNMTLPPGLQVTLIREDGVPVFHQPLAGDVNEQVIARIFGQPVVAVGPLQDTDGKLSRERLFDVDQYFVHEQLQDLRLHSLTSVSDSAIIRAWFLQMVIPTLFLILCILSGGFAHRFARRRQAGLLFEINRLSAWQQAALDSADYSIISTDTEGVIATFNRSAQIMLGYTAEEVIGKVTPAIIHLPEEVEQHAIAVSEELGQEIQPGFKSIVARALRGETEEREWCYVRKDGTTLPVYLSVSAMRGTNQEIIGFLGVASDLSESKAVQANLHEMETRFQTLFDSAGDAIFLIRGNGQFIECNPATLNMFACTREDIIGKTVLDFSPEFQPDGKPSREKVREKIAAALRGEHQFYEWELVKRHGKRFDGEISVNLVEISNQPHFLATIRDVTERKSFEEQLAYQAGHDSLTGLPNRKSLHEAFAEYQRAADESEGYTAMLLLDLDRFKVINDTLGHHLGDLVIKEVGPRLQRACADEKAMIVRLGGDEFTVLLNAGNSTDEIEVLAAELLQALQDPFEVGGIQTSISASIGVACYPLHGENSHQLLRAADVAMYEAKTRSLGVKLYEQKIDDYSKQRLSFGTQLAQAVQQDQLVLHYQPKIRIATGEVEGFEALVRWQHPELGLLYPDAFIDLVEMSEVIHPFTHAVIELAVRDKKYLHEIGYRQPVAINLSARNLLDDNCFQSLEAALASHNLSTTEVELELTESSVMDDPERAITLLERFKSRGVNIAVDDFGTGYSSLSYLRRLPVNALKIDRAFVMHLLSNTQDSAIVRSTIALAHSLDLKVIAEGVEDKKTLKLLGTMDCDDAQGYGICRPKPLDDLVEWLSAHSSGSAARTRGVLFEASGR